MNRQYSPSLQYLNVTAETANTVKKTELTAMDNPQIVFVYNFYVNVSFIAETCA